MRARFAPSIAALALLAPPGLAGAQASESGYAGGTVDVELYGHIYDLLEAVPMTTHPMHPEAPDLARGYSQPTVAPYYGSAFNRIHFFNSMGPVGYNVSLKQPRIHPERGLALDLELDTGRDVMVHWFMSADALEVRQLSLEPPVHAGAVPKLTVRAELRLGNDVRKDLRAGDLVAAGQTTVDLVTLPGQAEVTEVVVNLGPPKVDRVPRRQSFNLGVEWFQAEGSGSQVLMPGWNLHTGPQYPNRVIVPVRNPIYLWFVEPQFLDDKLVVNAAFQSPLGNYDVAPESLQVEITGPGNVRAKSLSQPVLIQQSYTHNEHHVAVLNSWVWDHKADGAPPGLYTATVRGSNLQGSAWAEKSATFRIEDEGKAGKALDSEGAEVVTDEQIEELEADERRPHRTPAAEAAGALLAVGAAALLRRRRGGQFEP